MRLSNGKTAAGLNKNSLYLLEEQDRKRMYKCNIEARSRNHSCRGNRNTCYILYCVSAAFVMRCAERMRHITLASVARPAQHYYSTLSDFLKIVTIFE